MSYEIISRRDAANAGRSVYFTGRPCGRGHVDLRYTTTGSCKLCAKFHTQKYIRDLNTTRLNESKGLLKIAVQVPLIDELEVILLINSVLIRSGYEPVNKTQAQIKAENAANTPVLIEKTPEQLREWAYDNWVSLHGKEMADKFLAKYDAERRGELEKLLPDYTHDGGIIEHDLMRFERK